MAEQRAYEVVFIVDPSTPDEDLTRLRENLQNVVTEQGGRLVRNEVMGRRQLAYRIGRANEGVYVLFEVEGTGREIAEMERRMRVNDQVLRYLTVRVDEDRQRAEKFKAKRARKASKRPLAAGAAAGGGQGAAGRDDEDEA
ncbi:MAG TPA: 30S ribosomal protein S6 [Pyrinomonadaceae bacterium]|nr:30S ribosomal protein S6 [Pyrinomonadaceae bacterium]